MAKKKQDELTPRQRQSKQIMRAKAVRKKRQALLRRVQWVGGIAVTLLVTVGGTWAYLSGAMQRTTDAAMDSAYRASAGAGFSVQGLYLEGRNRTQMQEIEQALGIRRGESIFKVDLDAARERLERIESIRFAAVERALPHTLFVRIIEREPVALWQQNGKIALVDDNGAVMRGIEVAPYRNLPLIIGDDAPKHVREVLAMLAAEPALAGRVAAAIRTGNRRWNIRLENGAEVKLPEENALAAWQTLADLQERQKLLDRSVKMVDLRLSGRLFITLRPQLSPVSRAANAKDT